MDNDLVQYKQLFISDLHLGDVNFTHLDSLIALLRDNDFEEINLLGDIFDIWKVPFLQAVKIGQPFLEELWKQSKKGALIVYHFGNHDYELSFLKSFNWIEIKETSTIYFNGTSFLVMHGHQWDNFFIHKYEFSRILVKIQGWFDRVFRTNIQGWIEKWSFNRRKSIYKTITAEYKEKAIAHAKSKGFRGIIVGHSHEPEIDSSGNFVYINDGDSISRGHSTCIIIDKDISLYDYAQKKIINTYP